MTPSPDIPEKEIRERCTKILSASVGTSSQIRASFLWTEHLFIALTRIENGHTNRLLRRAELNPRTVRSEIRREISTQTSA